MSARLKATSYMTYFSLFFQQKVENLGADVPALGIWVDPTSIILSNVFLDFETQVFWVQFSQGILHYLAHLTEVFQAITEDIVGFAIIPLLTRIRQRV